MLGGLQRLAVGARPRRRAGRWCARRCAVGMLLGWLLVSAVTSEVAVGAAGDLDPTFGSGGEGVAGFGGDAKAYAVAVDAQGRIVLAGVTTVNASLGNGYDFGVVRYKADGTLDS